MMFFLRSILISLVAASFLGCAHPPTRTKESRPGQRAGAKLVAEKISADTVILDARIPFQYDLGHLSESISLQWQDFSDRDNPLALPVNLDPLARRLARYGISPSTPVLVVGEGRSGRGEEGRLAWALVGMGIQRVQMRDIDSVALPRTTQGPSGRKVAPLWEVSKKSVSRVSLSPGEFLRVALSPRSGLKDPVVIDVRPEREYLARGQVDFGAINIPWTEFLDEDGGPQLELRERLESIGVTVDRRVILVDQDIRTGAAFMTLRQLGFSKVQVLSSSILSIQDSQRR